MILDKLENLSLYADLNPHFKKVVGYIESTDLSALGEGRHDIDGDNAYMLVSEPALRAAGEARIEAHDRYIDIQVVIEGIERHGWTPRQCCMDVMTPYSPASDIIFFNDPAQLFVDLANGDMTIYFPWDGHAPLIGEGKVRKAVIKVAVN